MAESSTDPSEPHRYTLTTEGDKWDHENYGVSSFCDACHTWGEHGMDLWVYVLYAYGTYFTQYLCPGCATKALSRNVAAGLTRVLTEHDCATEGVRP